MGEHVETGDRTGRRRIQRLVTDCTEVMPVTSVRMAKFDGVLFTEGGELSQHYANIRKTVTGEKLKQFGGLTQTQEQVEYVMGLGGKEGPRVEAATSVRDIEKAREFKEKGNDFYRQNNYQEAVKNYTMAIQYCPVDEANPGDPKNKDYSIFFANRSAAFDGAGLYEACIHDIDRALLFGYPRELWYKIYKRKGHAAIKMKQYLVAKEALETALKNVGRSDIKKEKDRDAYRTRIRKQMTVFNVTKTLYNCEFADRAPSTLSGGQIEDRGMSNKLKLQEDGGKQGLMAAENVEPEDNLVSLDPYVAVVNVSGGRAGGKICPHSLEKMFHPIPCSFGSLQTFGSFAARDEASSGYHKYEWSVLSTLERVGLMERARLALRMVTQLQPNQVNQVVSALSSSNTTVSPELQSAVATFRLPVSAATEEDKLVSTVLGLFLLQCLQVTGFLPKSNDLDKDQLALLTLIQRAVLVSLHHTKEITLFDIPKEKKDFLDETVKTDACGFGIYPDLYEIEQAAVGEESQVIRWFLDKKLVMTAFRVVEKGSRMCLVEKQGKDCGPKTQGNDLITFRCANELCTVSFPLKENTKEKIISCPLDDCGIKTNIWERLKLIQKLKKDFAAAKTEFVKGDVSLAKDIIKPTIDEWDRIIVRPYKEVDQLQALLVKCLQCEVADQERKVVEGNQFGMLVSTKHKVNLYPKEDPESEGMTSKMVQIK